MTLPLDPDWDGGGSAPVVGGTLSYDARGLPAIVSVTFDGVAREVVTSLRHERDGLVCRVQYGDASTASTTAYDACRRPVELRTTRDADGAEAALARDGAGAPAASVGRGEDRDVAEP